MSGKKIPVRFADHEKSMIAVDPEKLTEIILFNDCVHATLDGIRISIERDDYNKLFEDDVVKQDYLAYIS